MQFNSLADIGNDAFDDRKLLDSITDTINIPYNEFIIRDMGE